ncbi:MAG: ribosome silencing factor [Brevinema sp.]
MELDQLITKITKECERLTLQDIQLYDVKSSLTDFVIVATADHNLQLEAARKQIAFMAKQAGYPIQNPTEDHSEGWLAMDFTDLVVHILIEEKRSFYDLDSLMDSIINSRSNTELSDNDLEDIFSQLTPEEAEELLNNLEELED